MVIHGGSHTRNRAISYVYLILSALQRYHTCSSFCLAGLNTHHTLKNYGHHRHAFQYTSKVRTHLHASKLLEETNVLPVDLSKKWSFVLPRSDRDDSLVEKDATIRNILVCGDGDLSYSAEIASELDALGVDLYATVLEDEETHNKGV